MQSEVSIYRRLCESASGPGKLTHRRQGAKRFFCAPWRLCVNFFISSFLLANRLRLGYVDTGVTDRFPLLARIPAVKKIAVLPTLLTLGNGICGFIAITYASKIIPGATTDEMTETYFAWAGWFILFAMLFDMLDGYVARLSKTASEFGGELDSLCDVVSFGVGPAFLLLKLGPDWDPNPFWHQVLAGIAAL